MIEVAGPMFERAKSEFWTSVHNAEGAHYNNFGCEDKQGMAALRRLFPDGKADEMNFVLFSTSGIHGTYRTIEQAEAEWSSRSEDSELAPPDVTFLVVQPRICCLRHGNCQPESKDDFAFLKKLRKSSWKAMQKIGRE